MKKLYLVLLCLVAAVASSQAAIRVWYDNPEGWSRPGVHYWGGSSETNWNTAPNDAERRYDMTQDGNYWYYDLPDGTPNVIFRDFSGSAQTADIEGVENNAVYTGVKGNSNYPTEKIGSMVDGVFVPLEGAPTTPWANDLYIKGSWVSSTWVSTKFAYDADSDSWKASINVNQTSFDFGLYNSDGGESENPWYGGSGIVTTPDVANNFNFSGSNGKASGFTSGKTYTVVLRLTGENTATLEFVSPAPQIPTVFFRNAGGNGWSDYTPAGWELTSEDEGETYTLTKTSVDADFEFLVSVDKVSVPFSQLSISGNVYENGDISNTGNNVKFLSAYTDVTFTYNVAEKALEINGTKPQVPVVDIYLIPNSNESAITDDWKFSSEDGETYTLGPVESINGGFKFKLRTPTTDWVDNFTVSGSLGSYVTKNTSDYSNWYFAEGSYRNVTFTYNPSANTLQIDGKKVTPVGTITSGQYVLGNTFYIHYRNDADAHADWITEEIPFDKWDAVTNPLGLELHVFEFRANARTIPFYITNDFGEVINAEKIFTLDTFGTFATPGTDEDEAKLSGNSFTNLILGENYRVVCKIKEVESLNYESVATAQTHCLLGIFKPTTVYPWGDTPQNLHIHGNIDGSWPALGVLGGINPDEDKDGCANVTTGPEFIYNANTQVWYLDFTLGEPQTLNNGQGSGWEFTFTDEFGIQWYKADIELPYGVWTDGAMTVQTEDNDRNFYIKSDANFEEGKEYRMQIRQNSETGQWQMRIVVKPEFDDALYIKSTDNNISDPVEMPHAIDVNGNDIEGYYIYTMPYADASTFQVSTSAEDFDNHLLYPAADQPACNLGTPYAFYDTAEGTNTSWSAAGTDLGMVSVVVNYNTGALRVYSPNVLMSLARRHVERIPGDFDAAKYGVPESDIHNNVDGASEEHPVDFKRVNSISVDLDLTNLFFDRDCELTLTGLTINGSNVDRIAGRKFNLADGDKTAVHNRIYHVPYSGHLTVDGQFETTQPIYTFVLSYTITKGDVSKDATTTITYEPNFQPYFVRPRPVADTDLNYTGALNVKNVWFGPGDWAAIASRKVQFSGNTGEVDAYGNPIYYDYSGSFVMGTADLSKAKIGVYPGFHVTVDGVDSDKYHIPASADLHSTHGEGYYLANYRGGNNLDWSSAALVEGNLPVIVQLEYTGTNDGAGWLTQKQGDSRLDYQISAHYPLYVCKGGICAASDDEIPVPTAEELNAAEQAAAKAPVKRVHTSEKDSEGVCTIPDHIGVHSIVATRTFNGMTNEPEQAQTTGIEGVEAGADAAAPEYYNLQGIRVANPTPGNVYILRQGNTTTKVRL